MDLDSLIRLLVSVFACFIAAGVGSLFTYKAVKQWYPDLVKPRYTPPNWAFGPVWFVLYILMAVSVFFIWQQGLNSPGALVAFTLFWLQLILNALWSVIFFGLKKIGGGFIAILLLWCFILVTMIAAFQISTIAGALLVPYILWVSVATYLNIGVWLLNKASH